MSGALLLIYRCEIHWREDYFGQTGSRNNRCRCWSRPGLFQLKPNRRSSVSKVMNDRVKSIFEKKAPTDSLPGKIR
jgi:hypothetical protein